MNQVNIGILGCANIAKRSIIPAILDLKETFNLIAIASRTLDKAKELAKDFKCEPICGYQRLLERKDIDAVYIPLPTGLHKEWIKKALELGKHVYAEKSIAFSYQEANELVSLARMKNLCLFEGYMFIYHNQHRIVKELIRSGEIGDIRLFKSSFGFPPLNMNNFRYNKDLGGGVIFDAAGYPLRASHFIVNSQLEVTAANVFYSPKTNVGIYGSAFLEFENLSAQISFGFDNYYQCNYQIWGSQGILTANKAFTPGADQEPEILIETNSGNKKILVSKDNHFRNALKEFAQSIIGKNSKETHYTDILRQIHSLENIIKFSNKDQNELKKK